MMLALVSGRTGFRDVTILAFVLAVVATRFDLCPGSGGVFKPAPLAVLGDARNAT